MNEVSTKYEIPLSPIESHPIGAGKSKNPSETASNGIKLILFGNLKKIGSVLDVLDLTLMSRIFRQAWLTCWS